MENKPSLYSLINNDKGELELVINPHIGQVKILQDPRRFQIMLAGSGGGKTSLLPVWMYNEILRCGSGDYLAVSPTFPLQNLRLIPAFIDFFVTTLKIGEYKIAKRVLEIHGKTPDGELNANIFFGSAEKAESLESAVANAVCIDEAGQDKFKVSAWEAILRRVGHREGRVLITTTLYNFGWLKRELYDRWEHGDPDINVVQFDSIENPYYSKTEYERARRTLPAWKFNMQYRGRYDRPAGLIYQDFDENIHLISPFNIPNNWNWHVGIDPGAVHTALVWVAEDPATKKWYIPNSSLEGNKTTKEHVKKAMQYHAFGKVVRWVGGAGSEDQFRMDWTNEGIHVREPEIRDVEAGIDRVTALLREKKLFIFNTDENAWLIEEMRSYSRELDDQGQPTDRIKDKNKAHFCFIKDTLVSTISGEVPIQKIKDGDLVLTRKGYYPAIQLGITQENAQVYSIMLSDGKTLTGTGNHPVWVEGKGFIPLDTLRYGDILCNVKSSLEMKYYIADTRNQNIDHHEYIIGWTEGMSKLVVKKDYINRFGLILMEKFQTGMKYITKMETPLIISYLISNAFHNLYICLTIAKNIISTILFKLISIFPTSDHLRLLGTVQQKVERGTLNTEKKHIQNESQSKKYATIVVKRSNQWLATKQTGFVPTSASQHGDEKQDMIMKNAFVCGVKPNSQQTNIRKPLTVRPNAVFVVGIRRRSQKQDVYNLSVKTVHEYFANGLLVSNCDATRYFAVGIGNTGDYSTPVVWQDTYIPSFDTIPDILREDAIPQFK